MPVVPATSACSQAGPLAHLSLLMPRPNPTLNHKSRGLLQSLLKLLSVKLAGPNQLGIESGRPAVLELRVSDSMRVGSVRFFFRGFYRHCAFLRVLGSQG